MNNSDSIKISFVSEIEINKRMVGYACLTIVHHLFISKIIQLTEGTNPEDFIYTCKPSFVFSVIYQLKQGGIAGITEFQKAELSNYHIDIALDLYSRISKLIDKGEDIIIKS